MATQVLFDGVPVKDIDLMTPREVGALFRVTTAVVGRWARDGKLTRVPTPGGRHFRYLRSEVMGIYRAGFEGGTQ